MRMNMPTYRRRLYGLIAATLLVSGVFVAFPALDIAVSRLFYDNGFWLSDIGFLQALRMGLMLGMYGFSFTVLAVFIFRLVRGQPVRAWGYALATILIGPLGLVNGVFKSFWGRARPADITVFGGDKAFSPAWVISDQCDFNCAFTSGEGAAAATTALLIAFLAWPKLGARGRWWLAAVLGAFVLLTAGLRVLVGQHFLSDTLLSVLLCTLIAALLYPLFFRLNSRR